jgi:alcohol dehydrogenase YqhD (iron-dependent ADH family)
MGVFDDLDAYLIDNAVTATLSVGGSASVIFDKPFAAAFNGLVGDSEPIATGKTAALSAVTVGSTLTISGTTYTVCSVEADGQGMTALRLK